MIGATQGPCAGATLIQWNLASPASTPFGIWDVNTRLGRFTGSNLQVAQCNAAAAQSNGNSISAFISMRITNIGSGVCLENVWLWTADHDIDDIDDAQITAYIGRGLSVDSTTGNIWLQVGRRDWWMALTFDSIGTAVEEHSLFQYQFANTQNVFMGFTQTETP